MSAKHTAAVAQKPEVASDCRQSTIFFLVNVLNVLNLLNLNAKAVSPCSLTS